LRAVDKIKARVLAATLGYEPLGGFKTRETTGTEKPVAAAISDKVTIRKNLKDRKRFLCVLKKTGKPGKEQFFDYQTQL